MAAKKHSLELTIKVSSNNMEDLICEVERLIKEHENEIYKLNSNSFEDFKKSNNDQFAKSKLVLKRKI
jgi:hypothetical protein